MAAAFIIVHVLADDPPLVYLEGFLRKKFVGMGKAVEDESVYSVSPGEPRLIYDWLTDGSAPWSLYKTVALALLPWLLQVITHRCTHG